MTDPAVVENLPAHGVSARAGEVDFGLGQLAVGSAIDLAGAEIDALAERSRDVFDNGIFVVEPAVAAHVVAAEALESDKELAVGANEESGAVDESLDIDDVLRVQVEKLEEVEVGGTVVNVLLDAVEEGNLVERSKRSLRLAECETVDDGALRDEAGGFGCDHAVDAVDVVHLARMGKGRRWRERFLAKRRRTLLGLVTVFGLLGLA